MMCSNIFTEYGNDPLTLFGQWLKEAEKSEPNDSEAFCLATCGEDGQPGARMLLLKGFSKEGFRFHTHAASAKGEDFHKNPKAEMCFYWKSTRKQVRVTGTIEEVSEKESDDYFKTRPRARQLGAWASRQSEKLDSPEALDAAVKKFEKEFEGKNVPRPPGWKGYRLRPQSIEFWIGQKDRLHTRFVYTKDGDGWEAKWLNP